jgi:maltooligosyltrehalose trehalohydrolase
LSTAPERCGFGARPVPGGARFCVPAPRARRVAVVIESGARAGERVALAPLVVALDGGEAPPAGAWAAALEGVSAGDRYRVALDDRAPRPDPASRFQPDGVHGPSEVVDPLAYRWRDAAWPGRPLEDLVLYELHVGTFTREGTFAAAAARLPELAGLGVTAIQLMPVHDFPGARNWGYDPAALWAPARCYGTPDDLRALVDAAHALGLAVHLDVVWNHLGPDGAYLAAFHPGWLRRGDRTPWGAAVDVDGPEGALVRAFLVENAVHWAREYHLDGFRLDATRFLADARTPHVLTEVAEAARAVAAPRPFVVVAEDARNLASTTRAAAGGGLGMDAEWAFDAHHQAHRVLTGERDEYYVDHTDSVADLARCLSRGWLLDGRPSRYHGGVTWGGPAEGVELRRLVAYLQSHDEVGNRPLGERLHHLVDLAAFRGASALFLLLPQTPMLFMGQEWAAGAPFLFFTDHRPTIGARVTEGRRRWMARWSGWDDPASHDLIPDPQARRTFEDSRLDWAEREREPHAATLRFHRALLALRHAEPALRARGNDTLALEAADAGSLALLRHAPGAPPLLALVRLREAGPVGAAALLARPGLHANGWSTALTSEDAAFAADPLPCGIEHRADGPVAHLLRPGAVVLRGTA